MATKNLFFLFSILLSMVGTNTWAKYDISVKNADGKTIYYNYINDGKELEVTNHDSPWGYEGDVVIPEEVIYMNHPRKVTRIGESAFRGCHRLTSITIPNSVTSIGNCAFYDCSLTSVTIPSSVTSIGNCAFYDCSGLTSVTIPSSVTSIEWGVFYECSRLTSITIPNSVTSIGYRAFSYCRSLTSVTIPSSVTGIGEEAFDHCDMSEVISKIENPSVIAGNSFSENTFYNATLYVPTGTIDKYKATAGWRRFAFIEEGNWVTYKLTYIVDGEEYKSYHLEYGDAITPEAEPTKEDYTFSGWSEIPETMPAHDVTITGTFSINPEEISITSAGQTTWCSAYDLDFTGVEGLKAYSATGYERSSGIIWLTRIYKVPANEGILLIGNAGTYKVPRKKTKAYYANFMVGTLEAKTINETDGEYTNYYLSNGTYGIGFYKVNGSVDIKANRAYLPLLKNTVSSTRGFIGLGFDDDAEGTTGIGDNNRETITNNVWYNLQGQRVDNPGKGLYIKNGRKVFIR